MENTLIRCHPTRLRWCSEREVSIASLKGLGQVSLPTSVTELTSALSPGQTEDVSTSLPTRDDLRFGEVDLEEPQFVRETIEHSLALSAHPGTVANPLRHTSSQISPTVSGQYTSRELVAPSGQSPVVLVDTSPADSVKWFEVHCKMWTQ